MDCNNPWVCRGDGDSGSNHLTRNIGFSNVSERAVSWELLFVVWPVLTIPSLVARNDLAKKEVRANGIGLTFCPLWLHGMSVPVKRNIISLSCN